MVEKVEWVSPVSMASRLALSCGSGAPTAGCPACSAVVKWGALRAVGCVAWREGLEKGLGSRG